MPSLLPRPLALQAVGSGLSAVAGLVVGWVASSALATMLRLVGLEVRISPRPGRRPHLVLWISGGACALAFWLLGHGARVHAAALVGGSALGWGEDLLALCMALVVALTLLVLMNGVRWCLRGVIERVARVMPRAIAGLLVMSLVVATSGWVMTSVVAARALGRVSTRFAQLNADVPEGVLPPTSPLVSGSPGSAQEWRELGNNGMQFTATAPRGEDLWRVTHRDAKDPIRVYAAPTREVVEPEELARILVAELERTGAFDRENILLIGTTGRGWIDDFTVESFEHLVDGDCASAAVRYSHLPSPVAFLTDRSLPEDVGRASYRAVREAIDARPAARRPKLFLAGESLGSFGLQAAFSTSEQMLSGADGALWIGTPNSTPLWRRITAARHPGSPQVAPVVDNGRHIRFVTHPSELRRDLHGRSLGPWEHPRVVYLQHASDPIVWWSPELVWREPDWLSERAGRDVSSSLRWWPVLTWWMVSLDMIGSNGTPPGHGHIYEDDVVDAWAAILGTDVQPAQRDAIVTAIES